jgi:magnesium transporter
MAHPAPREPDVPPTPREAHRAWSFARDGAGVLHRDVEPRALGALLADPDAILWVDIDSRNRAQHALLDKVFGFHPLAIEDTLNPRTRVKVDEYEGYLFITMRVVRFCEETPDDPYDLETGNLNLFIGRNFLVTVHDEPVPSVHEVQDYVVRSPDVLARGAGRLGHMIMDLAVDAYFPILDRIDEFVDGIEDRVFTSFDRDAIKDIFAVKRLVLSLRRFLLPQREIFNVLTNRPSALLPPQTQLYFRDVYDHMLRISDSLENYRELLSGTMDSYLSQVSNRMAAVSKGLTVIATLSVPFVVVSGMWGMNFERVPLSHHPHGFMLMLALQLGLGAALIGLLRWLRML